MDDIHRLVHNDDPSTSLEAIANLDASGIRQTHSRMVMESVRDTPGRTATEIAVYIGLEEYQVRRRLTDLKNSLDIIRCEARLCRVKGTRMVTWSPAYLF